jgi:hypothetical protein
MLFFAGLVNIAVTENYSEMVVFLVDVVVICISANQSSAPHY